MSDRTPKRRRNDDAKPAKKVDKKSAAKSAKNKDSRSGAAKRAYERRNQRAGAIASSDTGVLPQTASSFAARVPFVATIIAMLGVGLAITLLLTTRAAQDSYELSTAREHNERLAQERAALQRDVQAADSAPDLAAKARELGMIPAKDPARLVVAPDGSVVVIGKPTPASGPPAPLLNNTAQPGPAKPNPAVRPSPTNSPNATPQTTNGPQLQAQGEQLVPMTISPQPATAAPR